MWRVFEGATWPRTDTGTLLFKGKVDMVIDRSNAIIAAVVPDDWRLLSTMRLWYEEGSPVIITDTVPVNLTEKDRKDIILAFFDKFIGLVAPVISKEQ
jgi:hypothetical protein